MELLLIDALGPFFRPEVLGPGRSNWSKVPFGKIPVGDEASFGRYFEGVAGDMARFLGRAGAAGYNAASLDDLAHLVDHPFYEDEVRQEICRYRAAYGALVGQITGRGMGCYVTSDILTVTPGLRRRLGVGRGAFGRSCEFLCEIVERFFRDFPDVGGIIFRLGEADGLDVEGEFRSELMLRTPGMVNVLLKELLPIFARHGKRLILRTWTVGAYPVGDLIWHRETFRRAVEGIAGGSPLVLSMKYGESDFYRYQPLNKNFFRTELLKIVELQSRREYEGAGEFPAYIGRSFASYAAQLREAEGLLGVSVWCQTGGWHPFRRRTYLDDDAVWNDINTDVCVRIFRDGEGEEQALAAVVSDGRLGAVSELMRLSEEVMELLFYVEEYAQQKLYFRRVRIPPLLNVFWDTIFINPSVRRILRHYVSDPGAALLQGAEAMEKFVRMEELALRAGLPVEDIRFQRDSFEILQAARLYFFGDLEGEEESHRRLELLVDAYHRRYMGQRVPYVVKVDFRPFRMRTRYLGWFIKLVFRRERRYRVIDRILTLHLLGLGYWLLKRARPTWVPEFLRGKAMGIDVVFR
jgi:hypothetical protein